MNNIIVENIVNSVDNFIHTTKENFRTLMSRIAAHGLSKFIQFLVQISSRALVDESAFWIHIAQNARRSTYYKYFKDVSTIRIRCFTFIGFDFQFIHFFFVLIQRSKDLLQNCFVRARNLYRFFQKTDIECITSRFWASVK